MPSFARHSRPRRAAAPVLLVLTALALCAPARAETVYVDGHPLEVTLRSARFMFGEPVILGLTLENRSETDLELLLSGEEGGGWPDGFEVTVAGPDGAQLGRVAAGRLAPSSLILLAGRSLEVPLPLGRWAKFEQPGRHTVTYRRGLRAAPYDGLRTTLPDVEKPAVEFSVRGEFQLKPGGEERLARFIETLGAAMLNPAPDAGWAAGHLSTFDDERIVKHFVAAYGRSRNASVKTTALGVFGRSQTDLALEGLKLGAADPDDDFRTAAAAALAGSKHPEAERVLAGMSDDAHYGVRLVVLHALKGRDTGEARRIVFEMANDPHEMVRTEALRHLHSPAALPR